MAANSLTGENIQLPIYKADGTSFEGLVLRKSVYESVVMSLGDKITGDVYYANNQLSVQMNEYVVYDNVKYVLVNPPTIVREGMVSDNGELRGMTKYSFTFYHPMYMLGNFPFSDVAVSADQQRYLSENKTFPWIGNLVDYVAKINKNLETTEWYCEISDSVQTIDRNKLSEVERFDKSTIAEALKRGYEIWEIPYIISTISSDSPLYAQGKRFLVQYGLPTTEILVKNGQDEYVPFVFHFGQGVGLKNNSRTPRNNKIVTRIAGYGSENNIPYGYPQIPYEGGDCQYPLYYGIVGGQRIQLIKHPFTRNHLMPSIYRETVNKKVNPMAVGYDPTIEIKDYYDADGTYENPIKPEEPSYEIHEFDKIKPELGEKAIVDAYAINDAELDTSAMLKSKFISDVTDLATSTEIETERNQLVALLMAISANRAYNSSGSDDSYEYTCATHLNYGDGGLYANIEYTSSNANFQYVVRLTSSSSRVEWDDTMDDNGEYKQSYFKIVLPVLSFDLYASAAVTQEMTINMRSGACLGCSFPVMVDWDDYKVNFYDSDGNFAPDGTQRDLEKYPDSRNGQITLILQKETTTFGTLMPNIYQKPSGGDKFVILGISLPTSYITEAEERLDTDMKQYMRDNNVYYYDYPLKFDEHFLVNHTDILNQMKNNVLVRFDYAGEEHALYIKQISIKYENKPLPTYDITLTDDIEIVLNKIGQVTDEVSKLRLMMGGGGASVESDKYLRKDIDDTAYGTIRLIKGLQVGERFVTGLLGEGGVFRKDADGTTYIEADKLYIRMKAYFDTVEVKHYLHSGGNRIATKASGINCSRVEYIDEDGNVTIDVNNAVKFRCYFKATGDDKTIRNDFVVGDIAFCKETNVDVDEIEQHGYWRMVVGRNASNVLSENNEAWIDLSNRQTETITIGGTTYTHNGYMSGSDVPIAQDDIIQLGNINNTDRQGAIIEYVGGEDAPSYQIYQGINDFSLNGKNYIGLGYSTQTGRAYLNVYGDAYLGDPNGSTYLRYDAGNRTLNIKAVINAQSTIDGKTIAEFIAQNTWTEQQITDMITDETDPLFADIDTALDTLQKQVDGSVETWFYNGVPSSSVLPESEWKAKDQAAGNNNERLKHLGDLYYDNQTGYAYRYTNQGTEQVPQFVWNPISDSAVVKALADAAKAQDTADHKRRVFVNQPVPPYDEGDLWSNATYPTGNTITDAATNKYHNDVLRCRTSKESGQSFSILDWVLASKYTDDSALTSFINSTYANDKLNLQNQIDGKAETWYQATDPSQSWTTAEQKASHEGDLWYDTDTGETFYFNGTKWNKQNIPAEVFDTIDGKSSIYTSKPTSYKKNDIWILEADYKLSGIDYQKGELVTATQDSESFNAAHWTKKVKYTDDAALNEFKANQYVQQLTNGTISSNITNAQNTANAAQQAADDAQADADAAAAAASNAQADADAANDRLDGWADDGVISPTEKTSLKLEWEDVKKEYTQICNDADKYGVTKTAFASAYTSANAAFQKYTASSPENITIGSDYANIAAYYSARQTILDAISVAAKKVATDAQAKADSAYALAGQAEAHAAAMDAVKQALNQGTLIDGGLVLSTFIGLRDENSKIWSGISGAYNKNLTTGGIAAWFGGPMVDKEVVPSATEYARSLFRFDGSGYVANGDISWDYTGLKKVTASKISALEMDLGGDAVATQNWVGQNYISVAFFDRLFRAYNGDTLVNANDTTSTIDNIKAMFGFWTEQYISAKGNGGSGSGGGGTISLNQPLSAINAAGLSSPTRSGSALVYYNGAWRYSTESTIVASALSVSNGLSAYTISAGSYITAAGNITSQAGGFVVSGKDNTYVLLAGGGTKLLSEIGGGGGTVTGIKIGTATTQYSPDADGVVTIPAYPSTSGFVTGISFNGGNPVTPTSGIVGLGGLTTVVKVGSTSYNVSSAGVISLPAYPSTSGFVTGISINGGNPVTPTSGIVGLSGLITTSNIASQSVSYATTAGSVSFPFSSQAHYGTTATQSYYKISINSYSGWMLSFIVRVYQGYNSYDIIFRGYNYGVNHWYKPSASLIDSTTNSITVYFGYDSDWHLWVAVPGDNYTGISVFNAVNGFSQVSMTEKDLFTVTPVSSLSGTIQSTQTLYRPLKINEATSGTVTQVKVGSTAYSPTNGVVSLPAYPSTLDDIADGSTRKLANYLPLTGGKLNGTAASVLTINSTNSEETGIVIQRNGGVKGWIGYLDGEGMYIYNTARRGYLVYKDDGTLTFESYTVIHSGNISSQSVAYATSAKSSTELTSLGNYSYANIADNIPTNAASFKIVDSGGTVLGDTQYNVLHLPWSTGDYGNYLLFGANNGRFGVKFKSTGAVREVITSDGGTITENLTVNKVFNCQQISITNSNEIESSRYALYLNYSNDLPVVIGGHEVREYKLNVKGITYSTGGGLFGGTNGVWVGAKYNGGTGGSDCIERGGSGNMLYIQYYHNGGINMCQGGGNVGIGTVSPSYKLHVNGTFYANGNSGIGGTLDASGAISTSGGLSVINDSSNNTHDALAYFRHYSNNDWGIIIDKNKQYSYGMQIKCNGNYAMQVYGGCIFANNVMIGNDGVPSYTLHVNGTSYTTRLYLSSDVYLEYDSTNGGIHVVGAGLYSDTYISAKGAGSGGSGSGGIDQATADARYLRLTGGSINGNVSISSMLTSTTVKGSAAVIAGSYLTVGSSSVNQSYNMYVNGTSRLANLVVANGTQGTVNCVTLTTQSSYGIYINTGNAPAYTKVGWSTVSDIRRKNIVRNVGASIEQIASAPVFDFRWKDDGVSGRQMLGTSAQYWQSVFPCAVSDFGILSLDYGATALAAAVVTARKVQDHEERILELERENKRLRQELEELKAA